MDVTTQFPRYAAPFSDFVRDGTYFRADDAKYIQRL